MTNESHDSDVSSAAAEAQELSIITAPESAISVVRRTWQRISWPKIGLFILSLYLFILALTLMKDGARGLAPLVQDRFDLNNAFNTMGFGWLFAYLVMSGSPVAASALTFLDAGIITPVQTFTMIIGSRMGASFIIPVSYTHLDVYKRQPTF